MSFVVH